jgi:signal transduction histidine kinase
MSPHPAGAAAQTSLATITHDLRTPLSAIKAWANVLDAQLRENQDPMVRRALNGIMSGIDQQASLLDKLADAK